MGSYQVGLDPVTISPSTGSTTTTAGERDYSLTCSATLFDSIPLPDSVPSPNFQWFFNGGASFPSGVVAMPTVVSSTTSTNETYISILQFNSRLSQSHMGMYTCQLGAGRLVNSAVITVNGSYNINDSILVVSQTVYNPLNYTYMIMLQLHPSVLW